MWPNAHWYQCAQVELPRLEVVTQSDQSGGLSITSSAPMRPNSRDWNRGFSDGYGTVLWRDSVGNRGNGAVVPTNLTPLLSARAMCSLVWEDDGTDAFEDDFVCSIAPFTLTFPSSGQISHSSPCDDGGQEPTWNFTYMSTPTRIGTCRGKTTSTAPRSFWNAWAWTNSDDHNGASEYYINFNGHHITANPLPIGPAAWNQGWTAPRSLDDNSSELIGITLKICRGDTLDLWKDDSGSSSAPDDYICSLPMPDDTPAQQTTESGASVDLACNGNPANGDHDVLALRLRVLPNPKYTVAGTVLNPDGTIKRSALALQEFDPYSTGCGFFCTIQKYRYMLNPCRRQ